MTADRFSVPAAGGRTLDVLACGPADGLPFVFHSGTPSGLVAYDPMTEAAADGDAALASLLEKGSDELRDITAAELAAGLGGLLSEADNAVISGEFAEYLAASFRAAVATGTAGWRDDDLAFVRDWGFPLSGGGNGAGVSITIWQGGQDRMVPYAHGAWLAGQLPGARAHLLPGEGHLTLAVTAFGQILADLLDLAGVRPAGGQPA
jgi:pimeloyl-ACP methyl ester carboxylesterase